MPLHRSLAVSLCATDQLATEAELRPWTLAERLTSSSPVIPRLKSVPARVVFSRLFALTT